VLDPTKEVLLKERKKCEQAKLNPGPFLLKKSEQLFYNTAPLDSKKLMGDQDHIAAGCINQVGKWSVRLGAERVAS